MTPADDRAELGADAPIAVAVATADVDTPARLRHLEVGFAVHAQQLDSHEKVLTKLTDALDALIARVDRFERRLLLAGVVVFAGTENGSELLQLVAGALH